MSRKTITLEAPNGAKVRTVHSKRYFVVSFTEVEQEYDRKSGEYVKFETPKPVAAVLKRTDSAVAAYALASKRSHSTVTFAVSADGQTRTPLSARELGWRAADEKSRKKFLAGVGNQGEARRNWY